MDDSRFSRRTLLGATGTAIMAGLAGCSDVLPGNNNSDEETPTTTPSSEEDFEFPEGFSETGMELSTVFSESGTMASLGSVRAEVSRSVQSQQGTQSSTQAGQYDAENNQFLATVTSSQQGGTVTQNYYFNEGTLYIERNYPEQETQYQQDSYQFSPMTDYNLNALRQHLSGVNLNFDTVESRDGRQVAVYTASASDFGNSSLFGGELVQQQNFESLESASLELVVDARGYIHLVDFAIEYANSNGGVTSIGTTFTYTNFNNISVSEPDWVGNNEFEDLTASPKVDAEFSETEGEGVTITVNSIENADVVYVVVNGSLVNQIQEPGSVTVDAETYTAGDGKTVPVAIYAARQNQQPTQIDQYTPEAPASGTGTTTPTDGGNTTGGNTSGN